MNAVSVLTVTMVFILFQWQPASMHVACPACKARNHHDVAGCSIPLLSSSRCKRTDDLTYYAW
jgi:hypothetical protein